tara:strand:- start:922 stop:1131 length:210 start_codon:yes stop_codon:yes gene_type:complete
MTISEISSNESVEQGIVLENLIPHALGIYVGKQLEVIVLPTLFTVFVYRLPDAEKCLKVSENAEFTFPV